MGRCVVGLQYLPSIEFFAHWSHHGSIILEAHEHFQKRTWRNKTAILGPDHPVVLTIPLAKGKHQQKPIRDVRISYEEPWIKTHLGSLQAAYGKTAFGEEVLSGVQSILQEKHTLLWTLNLSCLTWVTSMLKGLWPIEWTSKFYETYPEDTNDLRKGIPGGTDFTKTIALPVYPQVHRLDKAHQPNLSILDLLCHLGPGSNDYLAKYANKLYDLT